MESIRRHIAPLKIVKGKSNKTLSAVSGTAEDYHNQHHYYYHQRSAQLVDRMTPPATPLGAAVEDDGEPADAPRTVFHNYLRAFYPFHPAGDVSPSTVTLPLDQGDIILVHSVHINGWADGTLLDTGARGWLPTNYCEAYEQPPMHPLLRALTDFWDLIRGGCGSSLREFGNQDLMRGLVGGVRFLLEQSECLTRDTPLIKAHDGLRRNRKALLSELSSLVKIAKRFQEVASGEPLDGEVESILDQMLLKAFKIVTRGVRFLDVWNEEVGLSRTIAELDKPQIQTSAGLFELPPTPCSETFSLGELTASFSGSIVPPRVESRQEPRGGSGRASTRTSVLDGSQRPRPPFIHVQRNSVSHRVSYSVSSATARNANLASERLNAAYDAFLGVLGSFIGLHLQSRSSTELLTTTQQSVHSCQTLLAIVDAVWERDGHHCTLLGDARDNMLDRLAELVQAARDAFRPLHPAEDEVVFLPDEGKRLVDAATDCVRAAGGCVSQARRILEHTGDFEADDLVYHDDSAQTSIEAADASTPRPNRTHDFENEQALSTPTVQSLDTQTPPHSPCQTDEAARSRAESQMDISSVSSGSELPSLPSTAMLTTSIDTLSFSSTDVSLADGAPNHGPDGVEPFGRGVTSTGSSFTSNSNLRNSGLGGMSQASTRATSPDICSQQVPSLKASNSNSTLGDETDDTEAKLLETTYAHELMMKHGQVVGGSLRALIETLTAHQSTPDATFVSTFYLTFRLFTTPLELAQTLADRFEYIGNALHVAGPVRLRVYNVFKGWLESHWRHDCDHVALDFILNFAQTTLMSALPNAGKRLVELVEKVSTVHGPIAPRQACSFGRNSFTSGQYVAAPETSSSSLPHPVFGKKEMNLLKDWKAGDASVSVLDFDALELARQLTLKKSRIFCSILPEELLATEWMKKSGSLAVNVRAMSTISTDLANLVADSILSINEAKKRALVIKHWVKVANRCLDLNNYDSLIAIVCSLNLSMISRLRQTWALVAQKTKTALEQLRQIVDFSRNYAPLRQRLQTAVPPCLPFVGMYLTDLNFVNEGNQSRRSLPTNDGNGNGNGGKKLEVINFDKHMKTAKIIGDLQRFQVPYQLAEVSELQTWIQSELVRVRSCGEKSLQIFYRRSLLLEPRVGPTGTLAVAVPQRTAGLDVNNSHSSSASAVSSSSTAAATTPLKDKFDFLIRTHPPRNRSNPTNILA